MRAVTDRFLDAIQFSPRRISEVTVTPPGSSDATLLKLDRDAENNFTVAKAPRYSASLTISPKIGANTAALIATPGALFRIRAGLDYGASEKDLIDCGVYEATSGNSPLTIGVLPLELADLRVKLDRCKLIGPWTAAAGTRAAAIESLVLDADPDIEVIILADGGTMPETVFDKDRLGAIDSIAKDGELDAAFNASGQFVIQGVPLIVPTSPVWTTKTGVLANILDADREQPVGRYVNTVVVMPVEASQSWPVQISSVSDPTHPLHESKIGVCPFFYSSPMLGSAAEGLSASQTVLQQLLNSTDVINIDALGNQALEYGDTLAVAHARTQIDPGLAGSYLVEQARFDLDDGDQLIGARSASLAELEES